MKPHLKVWTSLLVVGLVLATGCQSEMRSAAELSGVTAIKLSGHIVGAMLLLDDRLSFQITGESARMQFNVTPGKHRVRVEKNGVVVLDQKVSVKEGETLELTVP